MMKEFDTALTSPRRQTNSSSSNSKKKDANDTIHFNDMNGTNSTLNFSVPEEDEEFETEIDLNGHVKNRSTSQKDSSPILQYKIGRINSINRYVKRFSLQNPRKAGAFYVFIICVLPLLVVIIVLSSFLKDKIYLRGQNSFDFKNQASFDDFSTNSTIAAVATDNAICSNIGKQIMLQGGNAMDAAVAATLCLGVISPGIYVYKFIFI